MKDIVKLEDRDGWYEVRSRMRNENYGLKKQNGKRNARKTPEDSYMLKTLYHVNDTHKTFNMLFSFSFQGTCDGVRGYFHQDYVIVKTEA